MSQQINLLLPELRPRFDWLSLPVVVSGALAGLVLVAGFALVGAHAARGLAEREGALKGELTTLQQQSQLLGKALGERRGDPLLPQRIEQARLEVSQRRQVMDLLASGVGAGQGFSGVFQGFSRQIVQGVWLVGFAVAGAEIEIRGRLTDPALLPAYVARLNGEAAFAGRRFSMLDMKGSVATASDGAPGAPYTEFVLSTAPTLSSEPKK